MKSLMILIQSFYLFILSLSAASADVAAIYQDGILTVPRVDTPDKAGFYQDAEFKMNEQGAWELMSFRTGMEFIGFEIMKVELIITDSFPVQVFLKVTGELAVPCFPIGQISQRLVGNRLEVVIYHAPSQFESIDGAVTCIAATEAFEEIISLPVYGLKAGSYQYSVNNYGQGTFTLLKDNWLPKKEQQF